MASLPLRLRRFWSSCRPRKERPPNPQLSSPLLNLPAELRHQIWVELLTGHTIHLEVAKKSLRRIACIDPDPGRCHDPPYIRGRPAPRYPDDQEPPGDIHVLPLLMTCRLVYKEAIPYIYASNTFAIRNARSLIRIPSLLPLKHLHAIRSVLLTAAIGLDRSYWQPITVREADEANPDRREVVWAEAWRILSGMRGLEELHVVLQPVNHAGNFLMRESLEVALEPVEKRREGGAFSLHLPTAASYLWSESTVARAALATIEGVYRIDGYDGPVSFDELPKWAKAK